MLRTVMNVQGESLGHRWSNLEERVWEHCRVNYAPYPERTLELVRPWFESIGAWYDWAGPAMREFILMPRDEDPALRVLREAHQLLVTYAEQGAGAPVGFPGRYYYMVSTIRSANQCLLRVVQSGPRGIDEFHPLFQNAAILALAEYVYLSGNPLHRYRWIHAKAELEERAEQQDEDVQAVLLEALKTAVLMAVRQFPESIEIEAESELHPRAVSLVKRSRAGRVLMENLIPGVDAVDLRSQISNLLMEDLLGPDWRKQEQKEELKAKVVESVRFQMTQAFRQQQDHLTRLYAEQLLTHPDLSDQQRLACRLYFKEGFSSAQVAEKLGCHPSTVGTHLARAREKLSKTASEL